VPVVRGTILHCSRFGAVVRLDDGRLGLLPSDDSAISFVRRAASGGRRPQFAFTVEEEQGRRLRLALADEPESDDGRESPRPRPSTTLEQKIIDYLRQTAEWDPRASTTEAPRGSGERPRSDRLLPFEVRARRQYRESPERPRRPKR